MNSFIRKILVKALKDTAATIENGTCELTEEEAMDIMAVISHQAMSKDEVCSYLNLSPSRFGDYMREGKMPKGRKRRGKKELVWYKDEIDECKNNIKNKK